MGLHVGLSLLYILLQLPIGLILALANCIIDCPTVSKVFSTVVVSNVTLGSLDNYWPHGPRRSLRAWWILSSRGSSSIRGSSSSIRAPPLGYPPLPGGLPPPLGYPPLGALHLFSGDPPPGCPPLSGSLPPLFGCPPLSGGLWFLCSLL